MSDMLELWETSGGIQSLRELCSRSKYIYEEVIADLERRNVKLSSRLSDILEETLKAPQSSDRSVSDVPDSVAYTVGTTCTDDELLSFLSTSLEPKSRLLELLDACFAIESGERERYWREIDSVLSSPSVLGRFAGGVSERAVRIGETRIYLGSVRDAVDCAWLKETNISAILNLCGPQAYNFVGEDGVHTIRYDLNLYRDSDITLVQVSGLMDWEAHCPLRYAATLCKLLDSHEGGVLVHCQAGVNRSASVVVAALMLKYRIPILDAIWQTSSDRGRILTTDGFILQLLGLAHEQQLLDVLLEPHTQLSLQALMAVPLAPPYLFRGSFPKSWRDVVPLTDETQAHLRDHNLIDQAKSRDNRLRKDQPQDLIRLNEEELHLLDLNVLSIPSISMPSSMRNRVRLTHDHEFLFTLDVDVIVNTANECLLGGGGTDAMTHTYAGESLRQETKSLPVVEGDPSQDYAFRCLTGDAVITSGHNLKAPYIIHVVTPFRDAAGQLQPGLHVKAVQSVLSFLNGNQIKTIGIGPISTGYYGYPMLEAVILLLRAVAAHFHAHPGCCEELIFWIYNDTQRRIYQHALDAVRWA